MPHDIGTDLEVPEEPSRISVWLAGIDERWPGVRRRATSIALTLALEVGMITLLLSLGRGIDGPGPAQQILTSVDFSPEAEPPSPEQDHPKPAAPDVPRPNPQPTPPEPSPIPLPSASPPPAIVLAKSESATPAAPRIKAVIRQDMAGSAGPTFSGSPGDSQLIAGGGPHGEPLYAARWYREPTHDELAGYLSTAQGPGYALINCRTVPDFRVDDCELVSEYPEGARLGRAVLAAAWQFKVRPPQVGGRPLVGSWVRIKISYELRSGK